MSLAHAGHEVPVSVIPFNGLDGSLLKALDKKQERRSDGSGSPLKGAELYESYVHLRMEYRSLVSAVVPDLVQIYRVKVSLELLEEKMRLQRQQRCTRRP
ncbi:MAG: hypothetical protein V4625_12335 [Pseudomonadota bacterium]